MLTVHHSPPIDQGTFPPPAVYRSAFTASDMAAHEAAILLKLDALNVIFAEVREVVARNSAPLAPERRDEMEALGYGFGLDRDDVSAPSGSSAAEAAAFDRGWAAGRAEWDRRLDEMCGSADYLAAFSGVRDADLFPGGVG